MRQKKKATNLAAHAIHEVKRMIKDLLLKDSAWETIKKSRLPIVLYGTGNGADAVIDELYRLGISLSAVVASEGFVRKRAFRGFRVKSLAEVKEELGDFLLLIGFATCIPEVMSSIKELCTQHRTLMPVVPVFGNTLFNRNYVEAHAEELEHCRSLLCDDESRRVFDGMAEFQFTGKLDVLFSIESKRTDALKDILHLTDKEDMLDLGAYRGDTIEELLALTGGYSSVIALEPDRKSFEKLRTYAENKENITLYPYAVYSQNEELTFSGGGGRQSTLNSDGKYTVSAVAVDHLLKDKKITYIKADVEGAEAEALKGMAKLLKNQQPKLSISCYHKTEDLCTLIPLLHSINPNYKIHLRHHPYIPCWDTNLYCV